MCGWTSGLDERLRRDHSPLPRKRQSENRGQKLIQGPTPSQNQGRILNLNWIPNQNLILNQSLAPNLIHCLTMRYPVPTLFRLRSPPMGAEAPRKRPIRQSRTKCRVRRRERPGAVL
jgi:hypothetical protein